MRKDRKGFTLVELLVTIILLGLVGGIVIYNMSSVSKETKDNEYDTFIAKVKSAASVYSNIYPTAFNELYISRSYIYITLGDLVSEGLLFDDEINPYTNEKIDLDELIKASLDATNGNVIFTYPLKNTIEEETLVAISDYVVYGEPYDCMRGIGSYELSLADEKGNLIDLSDVVDGVSNIEKYNFTCTMPDNFVDVSRTLNGMDDDVRICNGSCEGFSTTTPGNYEIIYNWTSDDGVQKQATRILRVLAKAIPSFKMSASDYDFEITMNPKICSNCDSENFYQPILVNASTNTWDYLTYQPYIEGADTTTTTFKIRKKINSPTESSYVDVTDGFINDFNFLRQVDDGDKTYEITAKIMGHYYSNYSYEAVGYGRFKSELIIPKEYIFVDSSESDEDELKTPITFSIDSDTTGKQSPVGIVEYEYKWSNYESIPKNTSVVIDKLFTKVDKVTKILLTTLEPQTSIDEENDYSYIYFRAKNKDGYVGKWVRYNEKIYVNILN